MACAGCRWTPAGILYDFEQCPPCQEEHKQKYDIDYYWWRLGYKYIFNEAGLPIEKAMEALADYQKKRRDKVAEIEPYYKFPINRKGEHI